MITILLFLFPASFVRWLAFIFRLKNISIGRNVKIGFSWIVVGKLILADGVRIGHLNYLKVKSINIHQNAYINHLNIIKGDFYMTMEKDSWINHSNKISSIAKSYKTVRLHLKENAKIGVSHVLDMTDSITIGDYSMLAGSSTQIWTHSFYYSKNTSKIARIDHPVIIGSHCYIGSRCCITAGVSIADAITIGAQTCVSKSLLKQGLYVSQPLRYIEFDPDLKISELGDMIYPPFVYERKRN